MYLLRLGIHTSTAGSLENAALHAAELGANTFQIFSSSPRMWRARAPDPAQIKLLKAARRRFDLNPLVIHVSYLVNLASADPVIRAKSIAAFRGELERAAAIGAEYLVLHPGSYRGRSVEEGIADFVAALRDAADGFHSRGLTVLLENTAGAGSHLGSRFEELAAIRERAGALTHLPIGYCLDTCHLLAAGFDISTPAGLRATVRSAESLLGLDERARVSRQRFQDSARLARRSPRQHRRRPHPAGRLPPHLKHPKLRGKPFILETPIDQPGDDRRNLDTLKRRRRRCVRRMSPVFFPVDRRQPLGPALEAAGVGRMKSTPHYARKALRP
jgi:deoxyribonuclease-4